MKRSTLNLNRPLDKLINGCNYFHFPMGKQGPENILNREKWNLSFWTPVLSFLTSAFPKYILWLVAWSILLGGEVDFCFGCSCYWCHIQKIVAKPMSRSFFLMFSSGNFMVSGLMFKSLIYFELIFVTGLR